MSVDIKKYRNLGHKSVLELETEKGILASSADGAYGCVFGRDSLIVALKLLTAEQHCHDQHLLDLVKKILSSLATLQGQTTVTESGEEPGKIIHEYREKDHAFLTKDATPPWYEYPDGTMRNYDTLDATPLFLITLYRYHVESGDSNFMEDMLPSARLALTWLLNRADSTGDGFANYTVSEKRGFGGPAEHCWMDSTEARFHENGNSCAYPIAPVEVQAYLYTALSMWANYFRDIDTTLSNTLTKRASNLKKVFNERYIVEDKKSTFLASALDGNGEPVMAVRSTMGHVLWASHMYEGTNKPDCILQAQYIPAVVARLLAPDIFEPNAGIRTLSSNSTHFNATSYHNGSIWPHDTSIVAEGLDIHGYKKEAQAVRKALLQSFSHFKTPLEFFGYENGRYMKGGREEGFKVCHTQAWSAASMYADALLLMVD